MPTQTTGAPGEFDDLMPARRDAGGTILPVQPAKKPQVKIVQVGGKTKTVDHDERETVGAFLSRNGYETGEYEIRVNNNVVDENHVMEPGQVNNVYLLQRVKGN